VGGGAHVICQYYCINGHVSVDTHMKCSIRCISYKEERKPSRTWRHSLLQNVMWFHGTHTNIIPFTPVIYTHEKRLGFPAQFFTQLEKSQQHYVLISYIELHLNQTINCAAFHRIHTRLLHFFGHLLNFIPYMGKISFMPSNKYCFHCTNFHETHNCSMALCVHLLYWISPKPIKTYGTCKGKYIYALSMNISELIFTKPTFAWQLFVTNAYNEFHTNMTDGLFADTRLYMDRQT